jgi:large subunit ribosomal protein L31e
MVKNDKELSPETRDYTIHLHKRLHHIGLKSRAPRSISIIKDFVSRVMKTKDVRIDYNLNNFLWSKGIKHVPYRVRVRLQRKKNEEENAKEEMYTLVRYLPVDSFKGLRPEKVNSE